MSTSLFRVQLDIYRGPIDLLLYLVRQDELDATEIAIASVTEQFLSHIAVLEQIDVNAVGDFLDIASLLIEIKSRMVLPGEEEIQAELEDPRQELVRRLLEYKQYRDAASMLEERSREWSDRFPRMASDIPSRPLSIDRQPIERVELWDLVSAFGRVLKEKHAAQRSGEHSLRRNPDSRLYAADRRALAAGGPHRLFRILRIDCPPIGARGHVSRRAGTGAASPCAGQSAGVVW